MKFYNLKDEDELTFTGKQLKEWKEFVIKDFLDFQEFPDSNISGRMIINHYWLEHLLNLFFQGYLGEVWEEIMDTEMNNCALIENWGYGIIGQEFNKKHLDLSNLSLPVQTSKSKILTFSETERDLICGEEDLRSKSPNSLLTDLELNINRSKIS